MQKGVFVDIDSSTADIIRENGDHLSFGSAGMRYEAEIVKAVAFRIGVAAGELAKSYSPQPIGLVVTASHNPKQDNGVKIMRSDGSMILTSEERLITTLINQKEINVGFESMVKEISIAHPDLYSNTNSGTVHVLVDNRESSTGIIELIKYFSYNPRLGIEQSGSSIVDHGSGTTPMLHYFVNRESLFGITKYKSNYFNTISEGFKAFITRYQCSKVLNNEFQFDCSHGIGSDSLQVFMEKIGSLINIKPFNTNNPDQLNEECGADYIHSKLRFPKGYKPGTPGVSIDGDADRTIFLYSPILILAMEIVTKTSTSSKGAEWRSYSQCASKN